MQMQEISQHIQLKPLLKPQLSMRIVGTAPLICSRKPDLIDNPDPGSKEDIAMFHKAYYLIPNLNEHKIYGFPATGVKKSMVEACRLVGNHKMTVVRPSVFVEADNLQGYLRLLHPNGGELEPTMFRDTTRNARGQIVTQIGAMFEEWQIDFLVSYWDKTISSKAVTVLLQHAGELIGLGMNRKGKGLFAYGTFRIAEAGELA